MAGRNVFSSHLRDWAGGGSWNQPEPQTASALLERQGLGIEPLEADASFNALRAVAWREGSVDRLHLDGRVSVRIGTFEFEARRALVWVRRTHAEPEHGLPARANGDGDAPTHGLEAHAPDWRPEAHAPAFMVNEIAVYLEGVSAVARPSGIAAEGDELLVTATTIGAVRLASDTFARGPEGVPVEFLQRGENRLFSHLQRRVERAVGPIVERPVIRRPPLIREEELERPLPPRPRPIDPTEFEDEPARLPVDPPPVDPTEFEDEPARLPDEPTPVDPTGLEDEPARLPVDPPPVDPAGLEDEPARLPPRDPFDDPPRWEEQRWPTVEPRYDPPRPLVAAPPEATITFRLDGRLDYALSEDGTEGIMTLRDNIVLQYLELAPRPGQRLPRQLTLTADRAVVFTDPIAPAQLQMQQIGAEAVRGVYLEGNVVATDGSYTVRGPSVYYEFAADRAIMLDAVLFAWSDELRLPIYVRAQEVRQVAQDEWQAKRVRMATSEFFTPHVSIGAERLTIQRREDARTGEQADYVRVDHATVRAGDIPFFYWPWYEGRAESVPLRKILIGGSERVGFAVETEWDLLGLMGIDRPQGTDASLMLDWFSMRGPAAGLDLVYRDPDYRGQLFGYTIHDDGEDRTPSGQRRDVDDDLRGMATWSHMHRLPDDWTLILEGTYISDPRFLDEFFIREAQTRREYQTRAYARRQRDNWALEIFANYDFNDFIPNQDLLQAQRYLVEKVPEIGYYRFADTLFDPGLTWTSEYQLSRMRLSFPRHTLREIGQGRRGFDLHPDTNLSDALFAEGLRESFVNRFTTRHEIARPFNFGALRAVPFLMGRFTAYDHDFEEFSSDADDVHWFGAAGVRLSTQFWRVDDSAYSRLLDIHRIRHIIEPSVTLWHGESNVPRFSYPIYDLDVEGITPGSAVRFALRNTWQTQRGGPGRWRSVDVLTIEHGFVFAGSETQGDHAIPRFFDYRPELSQLGDHISGDLRWLVSDTLAIAGRSIYDLHEDVFALASVGYRIDHNPDLFTFADLRYADADNGAFLTVGAGYTLTPLYHLRGSVTYDLNLDDSQRIGVFLTRRGPQFDVVFGVRHDEFHDETLFSLEIAPRGTRGQTFGGLLNPRDDQRRWR